MIKNISKLKEKLNRTRKSPNSYPKFAFRINSETKENLHCWVDRIYYYYQDRQKTKAVPIKKNDIILEALQIGLQQIEAKIIKTPTTRKKGISLEEWQKRNKRDKTKGGLF